MRERADERLTEAADDRCAEGLGVVRREFAALDALLDGADEDIAVAAPERQALGLDGGGDRLRQQRVGLCRARESAPRERLGGGGDALARGAPVVGGRGVHGGKLRRRGAAE